MISRLKCWFGFHDWTEWYHDSRFIRSFDARKRHCRRLCLTRQESNPIFPGKYHRGL